MVDEELMSFTCKDCGAQKLRVEDTYTTIIEVVNTLACTCGDADDGMAAEFTSEVRTAVSEWGLLDEEHRWKPEDDPEVLDEETEEGERVVNCGKCLQDADEQAWERSIGERYVDPESHEFYVRCDGCEREVEFGWSHPEGGRIWPAECSDFNPRRSWPEPRYQEGWARKGWLRPEAAQQEA